MFTDDEDKTHSIRIMTMETPEPYFAISSLILGLAYSHSPGPLLCSNNHFTFKERQGSKSNPNSTIKIVWLCGRKGLKKKPGLLEVLLNFEGLWVATLTLRRFVSDIVHMIR